MEPNYIKFFVRFLNVRGIEMTNFRFPRLTAWIIWCLSWVVTCFSVEQMLKIKIRWNCWKYISGVVSPSVLNQPSWVTLLSTLAVNGGIFQYKKQILTKQYLLNKNDCRRSCVNAWPFDSVFCSGQISHENHNNLQTGCEFDHSASSTFVVVWIIIIFGRVSTNREKKIQNARLLPSAFWGKIQSDFELSMKLRVKPSFKKIRETIKMQSAALNHFVYIPKFWNFSGNRGRWWSQNKHTFLFSTAYFPSYWHMPFEISITI